jgi:hypothetical protein
MRSGEEYAAIGAIGPDLKPVSADISLFDIALRSSTRHGADNPA